MSWGSTGSSAATGASEAASSLGTTSNVSSLAGTAGNGGSGFSAGLNTTAPTQGPTVGNAADLTAGAPNSYNTAAGQGVTDMKTFGTANPSPIARTVNTLERFSRGQGQGLGDTAKNFGNNPETYGAAYGFLNRLASMGKGGSGAAPITINSSYQQPENEYLKRYGRA